jgi:hypothetical protein
VVYISARADLLSRIHYMCGKRLIVLALILATVTAPCEAASKPKLTFRRHAPRRTLEEGALPPVVAVQPLPPPALTSNTTLEESLSALDSVPLASASNTSKNEDDVTMTLLAPLIVADTVLAPTSDVMTETRTNDITVQESFLPLPVPTNDGITLGAGKEDLAADESFMPFLVSTGDVIKDTAKDAAEEAPSAPLPVPTSEVTASKEDAAEEEAPSAPLPEPPISNDVALGKKEDAAEEAPSAPLPEPQISNDVALGKKEDAAEEAPSAPLPEPHVTSGKKADDITAEEGTEPALPLLPVPTDNVTAGKEEDILTEESLLQVLEADPALEVSGNASEAEAQPLPGALLSEPVLVHASNMQCTVVRNEGISSQSHVDEKNHAYWKVSCIDIPTEDIQKLVFVQDRDCQTRNGVRECSTVLPL